MVSKTLKLPLNVSIGLLAFVLCFVALPRTVAASALVAQYDGSVLTSSYTSYENQFSMYFYPTNGGTVDSVSIMFSGTVNAGGFGPPGGGDYVYMTLDQWDGSATTTQAIGCVPVAVGSYSNAILTATAADNSPFSNNFPLTIVSGDGYQLHVEPHACGGNSWADFQWYGSAASILNASLIFNTSHSSYEAQPPYSGFFEMDTSSSYTSGSGTVGLGSSPPIDTLTRVISSQPENNIVSTTTMLGFTAYINPTDYQSGDYVHVDLYNPLVAVSSANAIDVCNIFGDGQCSMDFQATTSGDIASSTTVTFNYGGTTKATWTIRAPNFFNSIPFIGGLFQPTVLATFSTSFVVGYQTPADYNLNGNGTATTTQVNASAYLTDNVVNATTTAACANILNGSTTQCLASLVFPDPQTAANDFSSLYNNALQRAPIGYATRFVTILSGNAGAVEPPPLTYTFGSSSPAVLQGDTVSFQIWDNMGSTSPLLLARSDDGQNKDIWDIFDPYFTILIELVVLLACLSDLFGFELRFDGTQEMQEKNMRDTARDRTNAVAARAIDRERAQRNTRNHSKGY